MSIAFAIVVGLLAAFALAAGALSFGYPVGRLTSLWHSVPAEERLRFGLLPPARWQLLGRLFVAFWLLRAIAASCADLLARQGVGLPAATFFRSPLAAALGLLFYAAFLVFPLLWSGRVLRQPAGVCSAALRRLALWTFPLSAGLLFLCVLFLAWAVRLPSTAA